MQKISVIIPCFNVEKYVTRCLESLTRQTLPDIEIICIDDCSTDKTIPTIKQYMATHPETHIRLISLRKNSGVSVARNTGIDAATGEYIGFVDPDDYIDKDFYEKLYQRAIKTNAEITVSNIREHTLDGKITKKTKWLRKVEQNRKYFNHTIWCAIYKTSFVRQHKIYNPIGITNGEDTVFCIKCACLCKKISCVTNTYYNYIRYDNSAESRFYGQRHVNARIKMAHAIVDFINQTKIPSEEYIFHFNKAFRFVYDYVFKRTTDRILRQESLATAIELYKKCKYPDEYFKIHPTAYPFIRCNDIDGLYQYQAARHHPNKKIKIKLFKRIPIMSIKYAPEVRTIHLCGIPILQIFE